MADMNIRGVDEGLLAELKIRAARERVTLREWVIRVLSGSVGSGGEVVDARSVGGREGKRMAKRPSNAGSIPAPTPPKTKTAAAPSGLEGYVSVPLYPGQKCRNHGVMDCTKTGCYRLDREGAQ